MFTLSMITLSMITLSMITLSMITITKRNYERILWNMKSYSQRNLQRNS